MPPRPCSSGRKRILRRLIPFLFLLYVVNFLDRVNVAYAALRMSQDLGFTDRIFGFGAGIFFVGYLLLEIPGALIVERWSARRWIARIMVSWGLLTVLMAFVHTSRQFYWTRFLLGAAEAGFFPGVLVYLRHWFREEDRGKAIGLFMAAVPLSSIIGAPLAGVLLRVHWLGLAGWRWLFVLEGLPAVLLGLVTLRWLTDWPRDARWLSPDQRQWIMGELEQERLANAAQRPMSIWQALRHPQILLLAAACFFAYTGGYGLLFWLPTILKRASGFSNLTITLLVALPSICGLFAMATNGWHSDKTRERRWHALVPQLIGATCFALLIARGGSFWFSLALYCVITCCNLAFSPAFWALSSSVLSGTAAAASLGLINTIGSGVGGFSGPFVVGYLNSLTGHPSAGQIYLMACLYCSGLLLFLVPANPSRPQSSAITAIIPSA